MPTPSPRRIARVDLFLRSRRAEVPSSFDRLLQGRLEAGSVVNGHSTGLRKLLETVRIDGVPGPESLFFRAVCCRRLTLFRAAVLKDEELSNARRIGDRVAAPSYAR